MEDSAASGAIHARAAALAFARERLGPASTAAMEREPAAARLDQRLARGQEPSHAALAVIHAAAADDAELANEFLGHFLGDLERWREARELLEALQAACARNPAVSERFSGPAAEMLAEIPGDAG